MARSLTFGGVEIHPDGSVRYGGEWQNASSCTAYVETAGQLRERSTLTRVGAGAVIAGPVGAVLGALFRKKVDEREVYLMVEGDKSAWLVKVHPSRSMEARRFAVALNNASREWAAKEGR